MDWTSALGVDFMSGWDVFMLLMAGVGLLVGLVALLDYRRRYRA